MGSGAWSTDVHAARAAHRAATGKSAFDYSDTVTTSRSYRDWKTHEDLDPHGVTVRESRDSTEHPNSVAISVLFDVTGSMRSVPRGLQKKLPELFGLLLRKGYVRDPQVMFGGIGDATCDRAPLQVGQFESDNRCEEDLGKMLLEGGGGGQMTESYELAMYFMARHTAIDCHEKRGKRGYLFIVGDELAYGKVKRSEVARVIGDELEEDIPLETIVKELQQKYDVYYILPEGSSYAGDPRVLAHWRGLLGQNVLILDDLEAVCETIALTIGLGEGTVDLSEGLDDLKEIGSNAGRSVSKALAAVGTRGSVTRGGTTLLADADDDLDRF